MEKYGVCNTEKTAGMGPKIGYCKICDAPVILDNGKIRKTCACNDKARDKAGDCVTCRKKIGGA